MDYKFILNKAMNDFNNTKKYINNINPSKYSKLNKLINTFHNELFEKINCLDCANCCKILGPLLNNSDIKRISEKLIIKESEFFNKFLKIDEDGDYIFKTLPCPFLDEHNYCSIYEFRPKACADYPHTDSTNVIKKKNILLQNSKFCPAVYEIIQKLKQSEY